MATSRRRGQLACAAGLLPVLICAGVATPAFFRQLGTPCPEGICTVFERPTPEALTLLAALGMSPTSYAVVIVALAWAELVLASGVALLLPLSRTRPLLAVVTAMLLPLIAVSAFTPALAPDHPIGEVADIVRGVLMAVLTPLFLALFPDGRWHPRWLRYGWPVAALAMMASLVGSAVVGASFGESAAVAAAELIAWLVLLGAQVHRYLRVSDWTARQQAKVLLVALVLIVTTLIIASAAGAVGRISAVQPLAVLGTYGALGALIVGLGIALFRYRLYGVDVALRRTVLYAAALIVLVLVYVGVVAVGTAATGSAAPVAGAVSVGVVALIAGFALFAVRDRVRRRLLGGQGLAAAIAAIAGDSAPEGEEDLAGTIARGLGLPYAAVLDRDGTTVWTYGEHVETAQRESVVDAGGAPVGTLLLAPPRGSSRLDRHHRRVLAEVLPFVVLVLRARAEAEALRAAQMAAANAREDERRRLRRDLHDGVGPLLASQLLTVDTLRIGGDHGALLNHLEEQARSAIGEVRRVAHDLRPPSLDAGGLPAALAQEVERVGTAGLPVTLQVDVDGIELSAATEVALLRIAQEALANVVRHAGASMAAVLLSSSPDAVDLVVEDNGRGADLTTPGVGTVSMADRAAELGGVLEIGPRRDGTGTRVHARVPVGGRRE